MKTLTESDAELIVTALTINDCTPLSAHTDSRGGSYGYYVIYDSGHTQGNVWAYCNSGESLYGWTALNEAKELALNLMEDHSDVDLAEKSNITGISPEEVEAHHEGACYIITCTYSADGATEYKYVLYAYNTDKICFGNRIDAEAWIEGNQHSHLKYNEVALKSYYIVSE
jgi:hypothetical protein